MFPFFRFVLITLQRNAKCIQINCFLRCIGNNSLKVISLKYEIDSLVNNEHSLYLVHACSFWTRDQHQEMMWLQIFIDSVKFTLKFSRLGALSPNLDFQLVSYLERVFRKFGFFFFAVVQRWPISRCLQFVYVFAPLILVAR